MMRLWLPLAMLVAAVSPLRADEQRDIPLRELGNGLRLIGSLHVPLGKMVKVEGVVVEDRTKAGQGEYVLRVQSIQGAVTQEDIRLRLRPVFGHCWDEEDGSLDLASRSVPLVGATYRLAGYCAGRYAGLPREFLKTRMIQSADFHFSETFAVTSAERIRPIRFAPGMFPDRRAMVQGVAVSKAGQGLMVGQGWTVVVLPETEWPKQVVGKQVEPWGCYRIGGDAKMFDLVDGTWHLLQLRDQIGQRVALRGIAHSGNGRWWLEYRGVRVYVENMERLPGWTIGNCDEPVLIQGRLEQQRRLLPPEISWADTPGKPEMQDCFVVQDASWKPQPPLLSPEDPFPAEPHPGTVKPKVEKPLPAVQRTIEW